ncbi:hypothetical protein EXIGLDRAFT_732189 [Exidia glandulosa HHB12029]|uniref:F-box domain-containing protein n=1 Tax=Exidia glandulosa HHB12029 TaxID=1314781 RepID=A0A165KU09_EXIGL|nr:hypothetical protein EXIGLDRAFT_732189 [Exidia glandulosa HHB12029]
MSSSSARDQRIRRISLDKDALDANAKIVDELRHAEQQTEEDLATMKAKLEAIRADRETMERRQRSLRKGLREVRARHRREIWTDVIPLDILRCIFDELAMLPDQLWPELGSGRINDARSARPFAVATVCSRWRKLAISIPSLWTYIAFELDEEQTSVPLLRMLEQIHRSKNAPLDVLLHLTESPATAGEDLTKALNLIHGVCHRLRRYEVWMPENICLGRNPIMDGLQAPTPLLESFCLIIPLEHISHWPEDAQDTYLPYTPKLRFLETTGTSLLRSPPNPGFSNIVYLAIWDSASFENFAALARLAAPSIQVLALSEDWEETPPAPPSITFPMLHTLLLRSTDNVTRNLIVAPRLERLTLIGEVLDAVLCPFFDRVASTVTTLTLSGIGLSGDKIPILSALRNVERLTFSECDAEPTYEVSDSFFEALANSSPAAWPKLESVHLTDDMNDPDVTLGSGFLKFVRSRAPDHSTSTSSGSDTPRRLAKVQMDAESIPKWVPSTVEHIMSSAN